MEPEVSSTTITLALDLDWLDAVSPVTLSVTVAVPSSLRMAAFSCSGSPSVGVSASAETGAAARIGSMATEAMATAIPASLLAVAAADESPGLIGGPRLRL
jgi:hypothetical protein